MVGYPTGKNNCCQSRQTRVDANHKDVVDMYPLHQSCICRLTSRRAPKLVDVVAWSRQDSQQDPETEGHKEIITEAEIHCKNEDMITEQGTNDEQSSVTSIADNKDIPYADDTSVSLWDLRNNLEKNTVVCRTEDPLSQDEENEERSKPKPSGKDQICQTEEEYFTDEITAEEPRKDDAPQRRSSVVETGSKPPTRRERNMKNIRKYCKWYFKSCQDGVFGEDSTITPSPESPQERTPSNEGKFERRTSRLSVPGEDYLADVERNATGESSSCSITPDSTSSDSTQRHLDRIVPFDTSTASNETSETTSSKSPKSESIQNLTRIFRRSNPKHRGSSPLYCGYSLERDYCVDLTTDRIFKEFLKPNPHFAGELPAFPKRNVVLRKETTQLRRQLMRKQYSDSAAVYYGQRMRRWRVKKQRSDSVNCPVDRATLRRQDQINEEFFPDELEKEMEPSRGEFN